MKNFKNLKLKDDIENNPPDQNTENNFLFTDDNDEDESPKNRSNSIIIFLESTTDSPRKRNTIKDFELFNVIGKGSYAKVVLARNIYTDKHYALKIIDKLFIQQESKEYEVYIERYMLSNLNHPNIVKLYSTFQDARKLYFILEYCPNRDLSDLVRKEGKLGLEITKFYIAEIVSALEYMHKKGFYHRDLKPENILLDEKMHLKICDFSTANIKDMYFDKKKMKFVKIEGMLNEKENVKDDIEIDDIHNISLDLVGTPEYVSPEVLSNKTSYTIGPSVDLWALGCILYYLIHGCTPFKAKNNFLIFEKIMKNEYVIGNEVDEDSKDLISRLLVLDPEKRLGAGNDDPKSNYSFMALKSHPFFKIIDWENLHVSDPPISLSSMLSIKRQVSKPFGQEDSHFSPIAPRIAYSSSLPTSPVNKNPNTCRKEAKFADELDNFNLDNEISRIKLKPLQDDNEDKIIFECKFKFPILIPLLYFYHLAIVQKKSPWFHYNTRLLQLRESGKLEYHEPNKHLLKGTINMTPECKAVYIDEHHFDIVTKTRKFVFSMSCKLAKKWVDLINQEVEKLKVKGF